MPDIQIQKKYFLIVALISNFILCCSAVSIAQDAPVTTCATVPGATPGTVSVPLTVTGFTDIGAVSLTLDYDWSVMQFLQGTPNPAMPNFLSGDYDLGNGMHRINMGWYGSAKTLPDGSAIMTLNFNYIQGNSPLTWFDNGASCEYADAMGNALNDIPAANFYINGYLCGETGDPGPVTGSTSVCQGQAGVSYSVEPLYNVTGYNWTLPQGAVIISGQNTNSIQVDFSEDAISGTITVCGFNQCGNGPLSQLLVAVNLMPYAHAGNDTTINYGTSTMLHAASGGIGTFTYHWSPEALLVDPDVQNPQTVILTNTTLFTLVVTNPASSACETTDDVIVTITGGPLSVNPSAIPGDICLGESSQLLSNAGSGSGNYTYLWTCIPPGNPPWSSTLPDPQVAPDTSTLFLLSVYDGYTNIDGSVSLTVFPLPSATISGGDTLCGTGNTTTLRIDLTGTPPWSFTWSNGITSGTVDDLVATPYYFNTGDPGTYVISGVADAHCAGAAHGSATVHVFPYPETPEITIIDYTLISSVCCGNQWYLNNEAIPGATGQVWTATQGGLYFDIITLNGCSSDTSETVSLTVGIDETRELKVSLSPNPAHDFVNVRSPGKWLGEADILVTSADGRTVGTYHFNFSEERNNISIDVSGLTRGLFFVTVTGGDFVSCNKLLIN